VLSIKPIFWGGDQFECFGVVGDDAEKISKLNKICKGI